MVLDLEKQGVTEYIDESLTACDIILTMLEEDKHSTCQRRSLRRSGEKDRDRLLNEETRKLLNDITTEIGGLYRTKPVKRCCCEKRGARNCWNSGRRCTQELPVLFLCEFKSQQKLSTESSFLYRYARMYTRAHMCMHTHTCMHARRHTNTNTHTQTHIV